MSEHMKEAVEAYIRLFNAQDADGIADLYADDATVIDPMGTPPKQGREAIHTFYKLAVKNGAKLKLNGPVRVAGNCAAFPFTCSVGAMTHVDADIAVEVDIPKGGMTIDIIDTFVFNEDGKVTEMNAYWGPTNITQV